VRSQTLLAFEYAESINLAQDMDQWRAAVNTVMCFHKMHENLFKFFMASTELVNRDLVTVKAQWSLNVTPGSTFDNSTFCPHSVFMCFVWISEQTAIIALYSIN
jgi:hypothetical protein